ncbi:methyl-accepting chemotaxis protein [Anaeromicropila herbilytica]|uniref:Methyl-accepting chemotaxis protein n=1 Tax=Anaeromicropila herbilytica TaxID=2785025 RepID=A0A7R7ENS2_9FIRM|nr:methyl-accepting chemotaxis protein [Anaeromicropila herbilytica]BCN32276.1 methyl-accepting chemotaxis protein [Anaeromicropila herbilytica]
MRTKGKQETVGKIKKRSSVEFKILFVPLIIIFIVILAITIFAMKISRDSLIQQMKTDGSNLAEQIKSQVAINIKTTDSIDQSIADKIKTTGSFILNNANKVDNQYLTKVAKQFNLDEVNYIDKEGNIIFSNISTSVGSSFDNKHIAYPVISGDKSFLVENIRQSRETGDYYKYGYVGKKGIATVQIGIISNSTQDLYNEIALQTIMDNLAKHKNINYAVFIDNNLVLTANSDKSSIGDKVHDYGSKRAAVEGKKYSSIFNDEGTQVYDVLTPVFDGNKLLGAIDIGLSMKTVNDTFIHMLIIIIIVAIIAFIVASMILIRISKGITNPLKKLVFVSGKIAQGDLRDSIEIKRKDEIGALCDSFNVMKDYLKDTMKTIKTGSLEVSNMSSNLSLNATQMTVTTGEVTNAVQEVAKGAEQQASDLVQISDHVFKLAAELDNIYDKINGVKESSTLTEEKAIIGKQQIDILLTSIEKIKYSFQEQAAKINSLNSSMSEVSIITNVINDISNRTNLLALNAAIEAARAGEAGRGFVVVSEQVRELSEQTKNATNEIQGLVESISDETKSVLDNSAIVTDMVDHQSTTAQSAKTAFDDLLSSLSNIGPFVTETYMSLQTTMESKNIIVDNVDSITSVAEEVSASSQEMAAGAEETLASTEEIAGYAHKMESISKKLNDEINKFQI